jgi:hypothetical protein
MSLKGISISFFQFFFRLFLGFSPAFPKFFAGFPSGSAEEDRSLFLDSGRIRLCEALSGLKQPYSEMPQVFLRILQVCPSIFQNSECSCTRTRGAPSV